MAVPTAMSEDEEEDQEDAIHYYQEDDDNNLDGDEAPPPSSAPAPGRFLTGSTYAPPLGKTTGTKKAKKALLYGGSGAPRRR